jgi:hypothetical protein
MLTQQMQLIHNNQILDLVTPQSEINYIQIGNHFLYPHQNQYFLVVVRGKVSLLYSKRIITNQENVGGYGTPTSTAATRSFSSFEHVGAVGATSFVIPELSQNVKVRVQESFYLMHDNRMVRATRNNFLRVFPSELRADINAYISANKPNFSKLEDLVAITRHFNQKLME